MPPSPLFAISLPALGIETAVTHSACFRIGMNPVGVSRMITCLPLALARFSGPFVYVEPSTSPR